MRPRRLFLGAILAALCALVLPGVVSATGNPSGTLTGCPALDASMRFSGEPYVTLTPPSGPAGSEVSVNVFNFPSKLGVAVILRVTGDPVVATGTTDLEGRGNFVFTLPGSLGKGVVTIHVTTRDVPCFAGAGARFTVTDPTPTPPPPTPTPTKPPSTATPPPPTATTPLATVTSTPPPASPTPRPPVAGFGIEDDGSTGGPGGTLTLLTIVFAIFSVGFAMVAGSRRHRPGGGPAAAVAIPVLPAIAKVEVEERVEAAEPVLKRRDGSGGSAAELGLFAAGVAAAVAGLILLVTGRRQGD
ncbi:MAG: hypothetical protein ACKVVT_13370 [Dehalococcoidia bacterium]